ncbi:hypothetical protein OIU84_011770 [Salix udensis]|uniref:Secreted protein n=1 Tax=Salix udensis TaxID=889485 RepID=A0AAD6JP24_9ROSI|nr:hypothetical protein OIU84_011770 [Salix udensis]
MVAFQVRRYLLLTFLSVHHSGGATPAPPPIHNLISLTLPASSTTKQMFSVKNNESAMHIPFVYVDCVLFFLAKS